MRTSVPIACVLALILLLPAAAAAKRKPSPPPVSPPPTTSTYVHDEANVVGGVQYDLTAQDVQATPDGGSIELALTDSPSGSHAGVSWLLKADAFGTPQWQEEIGCFDAAPGDYADAVSLQETSDGGYVLAGGTLGCGSGTSCPNTSGVQCGLVERLDATGRIEWARVYAVGADGTGFTKIAPTSDGGFVVVGTATDADHDIGGLIVKLGSGGEVEWSSELGPGSSTQAEFEAVTTSSDGGFVAAGQFFTPAGDTPTSLLVAKFDASGRLSWVHGLAGTKADGTPSVEQAASVVQTTDGGFAVAGSWNDTFGPGTCCSGPLLVKLAANGAVLQQSAYSGGVDCFFNGFSETCTSVGGYAYSVRQTADGGFLLAGDAPLELLDEAPIVPWLAKTDPSGSLVWQESDYQVDPATGRPLSEYFAGAAVTPAGYLAAGWTETLANGLGQVFSVQTDPNGGVGTCSQIHDVSTLSALDPGLAVVDPGLPVTAPAAAATASAAQTLPTTTTVSAGQC
jgi:hypothetical protein